jgi:hypothetical protein
MAQPVVSAPTPSITVAPTPVSILPYTSASCGVSLLYPSNLTPVESTTSGTAFVDTIHPNQSVVLDCKPTIPPFAVTPDNVESVTVHSAGGTATISGKIYHTTAAQDGSHVDKLVVLNAKKGVDVYLGGYGATYQQIIQSLKLQ